MKKWRRSKSFKPLALVLFVGVVMRLALWGWFGNIALSIWDERDYNRIAVNLAQRGEFALYSGAPTSLRPPLYPAMVAGAYRLFGLENFQAVRLLQAGVSLLNVLLLYFIGLELFGRRTALCASAWYCFYPSMLGFNNLLLTEVLFTFLLCATFYTLILALRRRSLGWLAAAGVLIGLGALTRSVLWLLPLVLVPFLLGAWPGNLRQRGMACLLLIGTSALLLAPWAIRNTQLERTPVVVDTIGGRNFMMGNYEFTQLYRSWDGGALRGEQFWYSQLVAKYPPAELVTQGQIDRAAFREGIQFVQSHPMLTLQRSIVKFFDFWGLERELLAGIGFGYFSPMPAPVIITIAAVIFGSYALAMMSGVFGLLVLPPKDLRPHILLLLIAGLICLVHTLTFGHSRYHLPLMPLLLLYSSNALIHASSIWRRRRQRTVRIAGALNGLLLLGWLHQIVVVDGERFWSLIRSN